MNQTKNPRSIKDRAFARWPEDSVYAGTQNNEAINQRIWMQYLGVLSLLGRVVARADISVIDRSSFDEAFIDANVVLRKRGTEMYFERSSDGGYAAFELPNGGARA